MVELPVWWLILGAAIHFLLGVTVHAFIVSVKITSDNTDT